jgi:hypothetical protein
MKHFRLRPPIPQPLVENDIERQCLDALRYRQWRPERLHAGRFRSLDFSRVITAHPTGTPDYVVTHALYPAFYLEVKRPGGSPTPEQEQKHVELRLNDLAVVWVDGYEALLAWLDRHCKKAEQKWRVQLNERASSTPAS